MKVIRHEDVRAHPCAMFRTLLRKTKKSFVHRSVCENVLPIVCARGDEIPRRAQEYELETVKSRLAIFGGHRPPLQFFPQFGEKLLMDIVEPAVAEDDDHVSWPEHRNNSVHDRVGVLLVECRPVSLGDRSHDPLRI